MSLSSSPNMRVKTVDLRPGLAVLRYTSADAPNAAPVLRLSRSSGDADLQILTEPDTVETELNQIGQCVVLRIVRRTSLAVHILPRRSHSANVTLVLEYLTEERAGTLFQKTTTKAGSQAVDNILPVITVLGHVSRLGDRSVSANEWLAGPQQPLPIEGFAMELNPMIEGLEFLYGASDGPKVRKGQLVSAGVFVGSRGRARPIRNLALELRGVRAEDFVLNVEALFLGSTVKSLSGHALNFSGPTGNEPLTGLKIKITRGMTEEPIDVGHTPLRDEASRVLVFR